MSSGEHAEHLRVIEGQAGQTAPPDPLVGQTIDGRYLVERVLGEGGMGLVYLAKHRVLNKPLAIKVLRAEVSKDDEIITRFRQEAQSASAIGNEHIIDISDFGTLPDGSTYFVMEFLEGVDLTGAIEQSRPMAHGRAVHIAKQLCRALGAAHERGIVHRDLKPDNIYLIQRYNDPNFVKVLDFGIAKVGSGTKKLTKAGQVFGTPHYMSPEQCAGTGTDHRTDIYATGVILYEMTSGHVPFDADNLMGILTKHMYEEPIPLRELEPPVDVPPALQSVILKCLAKKVEARYQTMEELHADLEKVEQGLTPDAVLEAVDRSSQTGAGRTDPTGRLSVQMGEPAGTLAPKRSKWPLVAALGAVAVLAAVGIGFAVGGGEEAPPVEVAEVTPEPVVQPEPEPAPEEPEIETSAAPENVEQSGATDTAQVVLTSQPEGAEVWRGDELIGNTPAEFPRPSGDERIELQLKKSGYEDLTVRISSLTAETVNLTLEEERSRVRRRPTRPRRRPTRMEQPSQMEAAPTPMRSPTPTLPQTEVLDPWS